jgi:hypothetical protein
MTIFKLFGALAIAGLFAAPSMAATAACTGVSTGASTTGNVTLAGGISDGCDISIGNPQSGKNGGSSSGFSDNFGAGWSLLSKVTGSSVSSAASTATFGGVAYTFQFNENAGTEKQGTWSISVDKAVTVDLVFAVHASNRAGAFLFEDQVLSTATGSNTGTWTISWLNNGGQVPDFSNLTVFARDQHISAVPEADTYAMLLAGLGLVGLVARRRRA